MGEAFDEILGFVEKNDISLVIISTHGRTGPCVWAMGSIASKALQRSGVPTLLLQGKPAETILQYAEDTSVSLIALATHGFAGVANWIYGSVASKIVMGSSKRSCY